MYAIRSYYEIAIEQDEDAALRYIEEQQNDAGGITCYIERRMNLEPYDPCWGRMFRTTNRFYKHVV